MLLTAANPPWTGTTFHSTCGNLAPGSHAFGVLGFTSPGIPLSALHPAGGAGCHLLASPDAVQFLLPAAGTVEHPLTIPNDPAFAGVVLGDQIVVIEFDAASNVTRIASSNALSLTVGAF